MKKVKVIILITCLFFACACQEETSSSKSTSEHVFDSTYELLGKDTINRTDERGRQGLWVVYDQNHFVNSNYSQAPSDSIAKGKRVPMASLLILEQGNYKDNAKQGLWLYYNTDGFFRDSIYYKDGLPVNDSIAENEK
jgi:hypothetical protein